MDKSQAVLQFLQTCPTVQTNPLFFNFGNVEDNAHQAIIRSDDVALHRPYIDGSVLRRFTFSIDSFKSVAYNPVVSDLSDENLEDFQDVQTILDWINTQNDLRNYPQFDSVYVIESMETLTTKPELVGVDTTLNPPMAVYRISIQIDYIDNTHRVWH
jgi:hypothetical protein